MEYLLNGVAHGGVAARMLATKMNPSSLRPYLGEKDGRAYIDAFTGKYDDQGKPIYKAMLTNASATLLRDEWKLIDRAVLRQAKLRLQAFADIRSVSGGAIRIPRAMGRSVLEWSKIGGIGPATTAMDPIREGESDKIVGEIDGMPLPVIYKDFVYSARDVEISRDSSIPLDTLPAELAAEQVAYEIEKLTYGLSTFSYAGYSIYGYTNLPQRLTQTLTAPSSANHATTIAELLSMRKKLQDANYMGPYVLYVSPAWDLYLDEDYSSTKGSNTLRQRILQIEGMGRIVSSPHLTGNTILMVQLTPQVARAVVGMDITTLQWEEKGGMELHYKVMAILLPNIRSDADGKAGICHGS